MRPALHKPYEAEEVWGRETLEASALAQFLFESNLEFELESQLSVWRGLAHLEAARVKALEQPELESDTALLVNRETLLKRIRNARADQWVPVAHAAIVLGVTAKTIQRWLNQGTLRKGPRRGTVSSNSIKEKLDEP